ncbi:MAG: nucleotide exchange factor GrpE [Chthoniobacterales bacterium]
MINVPFPYTPETDEPVAPTSEPTLKIDYTAIEIPPPKKTIPVRRTAQQTRLVRLENSLNADISKPPEIIPSPIKKTPHAPEPEPSGDISETIHKLVKSVGSISLATQENQRQYAAIATSLEKQSGALPKLEALQKHLDHSHKVETANQRLFDVMHSELKGYKDNFLFDALQKPVIRDLLALFDDLCGQGRRIGRFLKENAMEPDSAVNWSTELQSSQDNINNTVFFIIEVLNRLDVIMMEGDNTVLDLKLHKVVGVEPTSDLAEKNQVVRVVRPGFIWKDRVLRPTEVIIKKYTAPEADVA